MRFARMWRHAHGVWQGETGNPAGFGVFYAVFHPRGLVVVVDGGKITIYNGVFHQRVMTEISPAVVGLE